MNAVVRVIIVAAAVAANASVEAQSVGERLKEIFATPTATPHRKKHSSKRESSPSPSASPHKKKKSSPAPEAETSPASSSHARKKSAPTPEPSETPTPAETPEPTARVSPSRSSKQGVPNASLTPEAIRDFDKYPAKVQKLLTSALELTTRNLDYKYGSADPANGGMDCSGFVYFVLTQNGLGQVPRDSAGQYNWLRRAGTFEPVVSRRDDSFELDNLRPGDLLFWTGTYAIDRDPPITHAMIYLGREKKNGARVMVGASDGRTYENQQRFGVSVFDFKMPHAEKTDDGKPHPRFVGYAHIPGLTE
ncbi:MAG: C40 family peptidase [Verrucomicrobia bacterium]|nr:C40 family peptidase [Verrucomicrobiota bacterium]